MEKRDGDIMTIRVLTTLYNSEEYVGLTIQSLQAQNVIDWKCYITNDISTDRSIEVIERMIKNDDRFEIINNKEKMYQPGNYWQVLQKDEIDDNDICVTIDGDDWLNCANTFNRILSYYEDGNTWMAHGQFLFYDGKNFSQGFTSKPNPFDLRTQRWTSSHLRTFKAFLFRKIKKEDLIAPSGNFWEATGDMACFIPMIEMAGEHRVKYVDDVNYVYNTANPICDFKKQLNVQQEYDRLIRQKQRYEVL